MESDPFALISKEQYKAAFLKSRPVAVHHLKLLEKHFQAFNHTVTATELAAYMQYANHSAVNLHPVRQICRTDL